MNILPNAKTTIQISDELRLKLKLLATCEKTTYEDIINNAIEKKLSDTKINLVVNNMRKKTRRKR